MLDETSEGGWAVLKFQTRGATRVTPRYPGMPLRNAFVMSAPPVPRRAPPPRCALNVGDVVRGRVCSIARFGAFVEAANVRGLVHISELSYGYVADVRNVVNVGDEVTVRVLKVDGGKVSFTMKKDFQQRVSESEEWGHPWGDGGNTKWADLGEPPEQRNYPWQPDESLKRPLDE